MNSFCADRRSTAAKTARGTGATRARRVRTPGAACLLALFTMVVIGFGGASQAAAQEGNVANGQKVFSAQKCETCHGLKGEGGQGETAGPQIAPPPVTLPMFIDVVRNPRDPMPPFTAKEVSDAELGDVYAFLKSLAAPQAAASPASAAGGNATNGKRIYVNAGCYECHNNEGQGGAGTGPRLIPPMPYAGFVHQLRSPSDQMPPYTAKVLTDAEVADIYAYLQSAPKPPALASIPLLK